MLSLFSREGEPVDVAGHDLAIHDGGNRQGPLDGGLPVRGFLLVMFRQVAHPEEDGVGKSIFGPNSQFAQPRGGVGGRGHPDGNLLADLQVGLRLPVHLFQPFLARFAEALLLECLLDFGNLFFLFLPFLAFRGIQGLIQFLEAVPQAVHFLVGQRLEVGDDLGLEARATDIQVGGPCQVLTADDHVLRGAAAQSGGIDVSHLGFRAVHEAGADDEQQCHGRCIGVTPAHQATPSPA